MLVIRFILMILLIVFLIYWFIRNHNKRKTEDETSKMCMPIENLSIEEVKLLVGYNIQGQPLYAKPYYYLYSTRFHKKMYLYVSFQSRNEKYYFTWHDKKSWGTSFTSYEDAQKMIEEINNHPNMFYTTK